MARGLAMARAEVEVREALAVLLADPVAGPVMRRMRRLGGGLWLHSRRVGILAADVAARLGISPTEQRDALLAGLAHDVGKVLWPDGMLTKPGELDAFERRLVDVHPIAGYLLLRRSAVLSPGVLAAVLYHHEREDGSGYPEGLRAGQIERLTEVEAVADVYAALTDARSYRPPFTPAEALGIVWEQALGDDVKATLESVVLGEDQIATVRWKG